MISSHQEMTFIYRIYLYRKAIFGYILNRQLGLDIRYLFMDVTPLHGKKTERKATILLQLLKSITVWQSQQTFSSLAQQTRHMNALNASLSIQLHSDGQNKNELYFRTRELSAHLLLFVNELCFCEHLHFINYYVYTFLQNVSRVTPFQYSL